MASTGFKFAGTGASVDTGDEVWNNPGNVTADDDSDADSNETQSTTSDDLRSTNYDFSSIPVGATIDGIEVRYRRDNDGTKAIVTTNLSLVLGGVKQGTPKTPSGDWEASETAKTEGGASDLWGDTPTRAEVQTSTFGVDISVLWDGGMALSSGARVDSVEMNVHYTEGTPVYEQNKFQSRNDDGSETTATDIAAEDTNWIQNADVAFRLRFLNKCTTAGESIVHTWEYNLASAGWNDIGDATSVVQFADSSNFATDDETTQQLGSGTLTSPNNGMVEQTGTQSAYTSVAGEETEIEACLTIVGTDVLDEQEIQVRLKGLDTYAVTATITVNEIAVYEQADFRGRNDNGSETTATFIATANTNWDQVLGGRFRLRFAVTATIAGSTGASWNPEHRIDTGGGFGAWANTSSGSSVVQITPTANLTDGDDATQQLASGSYTLNNNGIIEVNLSNPMTTVVEQSFDLEWPFTLENVESSVDADIQIRVVREGNALDTYTNIPTLTGFRFVIQEPQQPGIGWPNEETRAWRQRNRERLK